VTEGAPDRRGLSIFDNAATGGFHVRSRGYDREQVERYVRKLEDKLREATARGAERGELLSRAEERIAELSGEVTSLRARVEQAEGKLRNVDQPSFSGLGEHVAVLLSSAEEQAAALRGAAATEAERTRAQATAEADRLRAAARAEAEQAHREAEAARQQAEEDARRLRAQADADASRVRQEAGEDATAARVAAVNEAKALVADAKAAAADVRSAADADAEAQREAAATLLHQARQRADHQLGAVTAGLSALHERLTADGISVEPVGETSEVEVEAGARSEGDDDETQLFPVVGRP
jgi:cell division septum initiation protein DivIVA